MNFTNLYRSLILTGTLAGLLGFSLLAGCDLKKHQTIKEEQQTRWNGARIGVLYQLADQQYRVGDYDKCRDTLRQALAINQPFAPISILAARLELEKGSLEDAAAYLKTATQLDADNPEPYYLLGVVYQRWQNNQTAHDYYKLAWDKRPNDSRYLLAFIEMKISISEIEAARKILEDKLVYFEQTAAVRVALAKIHTLKGDYEAAAKFYRDATLLSPDDLGIRRSYAETLFFAGRYRDALPVLEGLQDNPDITDRSTLLAMLGRTYLQLHRIRDARNCFADVTREQPHDQSAWLALGQATLQLNDYPQASGVARRIIKAEPRNVQAYILLALCQQKQRQYDDARATLVRAQQIAPTDSTVLCLLGLDAQRQGKLDDAAACYRQAVQSDPKNTWAQELLSAVPMPGATREQ